MAVQNRIVKVQKRNRALVTFDRGPHLQGDLARGGIHRRFSAGLSAGHQRQDFRRARTDEKIAAFIADAVIVCLNSDPQHLIANFPPTIETIQDRCCMRCAVTVSKTRRTPTHVIAGAGIGCAKARSRRSNSPATVFRGSAWSGRSNGTASAGATRWRGSTKSCAAAKSSRSSTNRSRNYEASLDEAAAKVLARLNAGRDICA